MIVFTVELVVMDKLVSFEVMDVVVAVGVVVLVVVVGFVAVVVAVTGARIADVVVFRSEPSRLVERVEVVLPLVG